MEFYRPQEVPKLAVPYSPAAYTLLVKSNIFPRALKPIFTLHSNDYEYSEARLLFRVPQRGEQRGAVGGKGEATMEKPCGVKSLNAARRRTVGRILRADYGCLKAAHRLQTEVSFRLLTRAASNAKLPGQ